MVVKLHALTEHPPRVRPARAKRQWMDDFPDRHAYRCLPLSIANAFGWEVLCPIPLEIRWNGGMAVEDIQVIALKELPGDAPVDYFCRSNFSRGIITFHLDYVIETEPGWGILATGPFNDPKPGATPLSGIIESDWLPYPFTMNWQLTKPGIIRFEEGEPFCFFLPVPRHVLPNTELQVHGTGPRRRPGRDQEGLAAALFRWSPSRWDVGLRAFEQAAPEGAGRRAPAGRDGAAGAESGAPGERRRARKGQPALGGRQFAQQDPVLHGHRGDPEPDEDRLRGPVRTGSRD
jgi:hypothetical protein